MANIHNAVSNTLEDLGMSNMVHTIIDQDPNDSSRWLVTFETPANARLYAKLHMEILYLPDNNVAACVLRRVRISRSRMIRIMDTLMDYLTPDPVVWEPPQAVVGQPCQY